MRSFVASEPPSYSRIHLLRQVVVRVTGAGGRPPRGPEANELGDGIVVQRPSLRRTGVAALASVVALLLIGCGPVPFDFHIENTTDETLWVTIEDAEGAEAQQSSPANRTDATTLGPGDRFVETVRPDDFTHRTETNYGSLIARNAADEIRFSGPLVLLAARDEGCVARLGDPLVADHVDCRHREPLSEEVRLQLERADRALRWIEAQPWLLLAMAVGYTPIALVLLQSTGGFSRPLEQSLNEGREGAALGSGIVGFVLALPIATLIAIPGGGVVEIPLVATSLAGILVLFGRSPRRRQAVSSSLLLLGGAHLILTGIDSATLWLWEDDTISELISALLWGWALIGAPGALAVVAGLLLRSRDDLDVGVDPETADSQARLETIAR